MCPRPFNTQAMTLITTKIVLQQPIQTNSAVGGTAAAPAQNAIILSPKITNGIVSTTVMIVLPIIFARNVRRTQAISLRAKASAYAGHSEGNNRVWNNTAYEKRRHATLYGVTWLTPM